MKTKSNLILSTLIICGLVLASLQFAIIVKADTSVENTITSNTTWTAANSPYILSAPITVDNDATLTVEAGASVDLNSYSLQVNGVLHAVGSDTAKVQFNNGKIVFSASSEEWDDQRGSGSVIEEAILNQTAISSVNAVKVSKNTINGPDDAGVGALSTGGFSIISNNTIVSTTGRGYGIIVKEGIASISGNIISGYAIGIWTASEASIQQNSILNCGCGIGVGKIIGTSFDTYQFGEVSVTLKDNTIANNYIGIGGPIFNGKVPISSIVATGEVTAQRNYIDSNTYGLALGAYGSFTYNTISNSKTAVTIYDTSGTLSPHFDSNNIIDYQQSVNQLGPKDVWMEGNYWGTTDLQSINASIHDKVDNPVLGLIYFGGASSSRYIDAPAQPPTPIPDLPTPEWSPTTNPDESATQTPTPSNGSPNSNSYFQVESNSTITELFFNSTSSELSFKVTGPSGTTGYVQYKIAKSLLASVQNVKVFLDGSQLNVNITSEGNSWLLYFAYHHSSHNVVISLAEASESRFDGTLVVWIAVPVVFCAVLVATLVFWRRKRGLASRQ
jgi:hypothetical protein